MNLKSFFVALCVAMSLTSEAQNFKTVKIGNRVWMAENLSIDVPGSWCYEYKDENGRKYGRLYTWDAALKACPAGWHIATDQEWSELAEFLGGEDVAGAAIRAGGNSGFNASYGGLCDNSNFRLLGIYGCYWTGTSYNSKQAWYRYFTTSDGGLTRTYFSKSYGFCVRCVRNN